MSWRCGSPGVASASAARLPSLSTVIGYAVAEPGPQQLADRHVVPAEVGTEGEPVALAVDEAGHAHGQADRLDVAVREVGDRLPDQLGEPVEHLLGRDRASVEGELVLAHHLAA